MKQNYSNQINVICVTLIFLFSSCASIVSKSIYPISINSNPSGANITITDNSGMEVYKGNTPATVKLKAGAGFFTKAEYQVKFSMSGYSERIVPVNFSIDGWYFGNIFLGGLIGMLIVDPATGAMWKIDTEYMNETLSPANSALYNPELRVIDNEAIPEILKEHLVRIN